MRSIFSTYSISKKTSSTPYLQEGSSLKQQAKKITAKEKLEEVLTQKGIGFKPFDPKQTFNAMSQYIKDDGVRATPTIIIDNGTEKQPFVGIDNIVNALELLK